MKLKFYWLAPIVFITLFSCNEQDKTKRPAGDQLDTIIALKKSLPYTEQDSIALLQLTKKLYEWNETDNNDDFFSPLQRTETDTVYASLDMNFHKQKLGEMRSSGLFTEGFIKNYNKIALLIDNGMRDGSLKWNIGEMPPFGNGANPWCNCQDQRDDFLSKLYIMHLQADNGGLFYNWADGSGGTPYNIKALKEGKQWKINYMEGFDYNSFERRIEEGKGLTGKWGNEMVVLNIGETTLAFEYHGQCVYFYPLKKISNTEFEMIWARDMDCKFDNGTKETFGIKETPQLGKPFAKFTLKNKTLHVEYYYKEWVRKYSEQVQSGVFSENYKRNNQL